MNISLQSKALIALQFIIILLLLMINDSIINHWQSLYLSMSGFIFGLYTFYFNRLGNFNIAPEIKSEAKLITNGAYKYIRHPMYFSVLLIMLGVVLTEISMVNILLYIGLIFVLYLKASKEEKLWSEKMLEYGEYKKRTKMFIPFVL